MSLYRLGALVRKEILQMLRDRLLVTFLLVGPVIQLVLLASTVGRRPPVQPLAVVDYDRSYASRRLVTALDNTRDLSLRYLLDDSGEGKRLLATGKAEALVVIPAGFERDLFAGREPQVELLVDGSNTVVASDLISAADEAISSASRSFVQSPGWTFGLPGGIDLRLRALFNQSMNDRPFTITAQMAFLVFQITVVVAAVSLVREKEQGTLEQLWVTPVRRLELLMGKAVPALFTGF
jgi:ABC-2 type transport system permease protein